jgi:hypothetical protein
MIRHISRVQHSAAGVALCPPKIEKIAAHRRLRELHHKPTANSAPRFDRFERRRFYSSFAPFARPSAALARVVQLWVVVGPMKRQSVASACLLVILALGAAGVWQGCRTGGDPVLQPGVKAPVKLCQAEPAICQLLCAKSPDPGACMEANGNCQAPDVYYIDDVAFDKAGDIWTAGCHWSFSDAVCTQNKAFHLGDLCGEGNRNAIIEWNNSECHGAQGDIDMLDCADECKRRGLAGTCVHVPNHCGPGQHSARCECVKISG